MRRQLHESCAWLCLASFAASCYESRPAQRDHSIAPPAPTTAERRGTAQAFPARRPSTPDPPSELAPARDAQVSLDPRAPAAAPARDASIVPAASNATPVSMQPGDAGAAVVPEDAPTAFRSELRVAFIGDQGMSSAAREVLDLIRRERAVLVVHAGDLSYGAAEPIDWEAQIDQALGPAFPYLVAIGNHDVDDWEGPAGFAELLAARLARTPDVSCHGQLGLNTICGFRGLEILLSGVATYGAEHEAFLESELARSAQRVRLCVWHKNQHDMQVGAKTDEVGWAAYRICAQHGAAIFTGHEHSYARTFTLTALGERELGHGATGDPALVHVGPGSALVVVSGLGGQSIRSRTADHELDTWWASIYANDYQQRNGAETGRLPAIEPGALFIDFNADGDPGKAHAFFKTVTGTIADDFEIEFAQQSVVAERAH